jgi:hypothetical protein
LNEIHGVTQTEIGLKSRLRIKRTSKTRTGAGPTKAVRENELRKNNFLEILKNFARRLRSLLQKRSPLWAVRLVTKDFNG